MDKEFLNKVVNQIISETIIDYEKGEIQFPFGFPSFNKTMIYTIDFHVTMELFSNSSFSVALPSFSSFAYHCIEVYGLNDDEVDYVWDEYRNIIIDKIESNG